MGLEIILSTTSIMAIRSEERRQMQRGHTIVVFTLNYEKLMSSLNLMLFLTQLLL